MILGCGSLGELTFLFLRPGYEYEAPFFSQNSWIYEVKAASNQFTRNRSERLLSSNDHAQDNPLLIFIGHSQLSNSSLIMPNLPENSVYPASRAKWRDWLEANHQRKGGVWFVSNKKASGKPRIPYAEAVEEALCFGWVDSQPRKLDRDRSMLWFSPRKARSGWSRPNKERVERLVATGKMMPAGLAKIDASKADGSWTKLDAVEALEIPEELATEFKRYESAQANFEAFPRSAKRGILEWIVQAKRPETRSKRIAETARLAQENIRANQWRQSKEAN